MVKSRDSVLIYRIFRQLAVSPFEHVSSRRQVLRRKRLGSSLVPDTNHLPVLKSFPRCLRKKKKQKKKEGEKKGHCTHEVRCKPAHRNVARQHPKQDVWNWSRQLQLKLIQLRAHYSAVFNFIRSYIGVDTVVYSVLGTWWWLHMCMDFWTHICSTQPNRSGFSCQCALAHIPMSAKRT